MGHRVQRSSPILRADWHSVLADRFRAEERPDRDGPVTSDHGEKDNNLWGGSPRGASIHIFMLMWTG
eukprot:4143795-Pyramimonas_sp.AAC.1